MFSHSDGILYCNPPMQAIKDSKESAQHNSEFSIIINRHSSGIELEAAPDSTWKVIPNVIPAKVLFCLVVVKLIDYIFFRSTWQLSLIINLEESFHKSQ